MSLSLYLSRPVNIEEINNLTDLKAVTKANTIIKDGVIETYILDEYGNRAHHYNNMIVFSGITTNPTKIMDELATKLGISFLDTDWIDTEEESDIEQMFDEYMLCYNYIRDGDTIIAPERDIYESYQEIF